MAKLKNFQVTIHANKAWGAYTPDGRRANQVEIVVRTTSQVKAAEAFSRVVNGRDITPHYVRNYGSETGNQETLSALDQYPPGTVLIGPLDHGGTVLGHSSGWVKLDG